MASPAPPSGSSALQENLDALLDSALNDFAEVQTLRPSRGKGGAGAPSATASTSGEGGGFDPLGSARQPKDAAKKQTAAAGMGLGFDPLARPAKKKGGKGKARGGSAASPPTLPPGVSPDLIANMEDMANMDPANMDEMVQGLSQLMEEFSRFEAESSKGGGGIGGEDPQQALQRTLAALQAQSTGDGPGWGTEAGGAEDDDFLKHLGAEGGDMSGLLESMMQQLLSKEVLYQPLKDMSQKYPAWLEQHRPTLAPEAVEQYETQQRLIGELLHVYETTPNDYPRITALLQQMQECGQPPAELIKELAPGVQFGADGLPELPADGGGLPPELAQQCCLQ